MKSLVKLLELMLQDCSTRCDAPIRRDILTISRRVEHEGDSFITITLPTFCVDLERALADGRIAPTMFCGFTKHGCRPAFLQAFMCKVFDSSGLLLDNPNSDCILAIRQICLFAKKVYRPCSDARLSNAELAFIKCDSEVDNAPSGALWDTFQKVSKIVMSSILSDCYYEELVPQHGSGTTAEKILGNKKFQTRIWHSRLESYFPYSEFALGSVRNLGLNETADPVFREPGEEQPVRVVFVPKTLKTPRVIAIEPVCMQYAQQAVSKWLVPRIETGRYTSGHVNFRNQSVNQALAFDASVNGRMATIDLSEASDRVSLAMATALLDVHPEFRELVLSCRSQRACLPSGKELPLNKFASMGSALCFPIEAMVFFCAIVSSRLMNANSQVTARSVYTLSRDVYVYGDDLIVPANEASAICVDLEAIGLKINSRKSFWSGKFRESCGSDYYDGVKVTPCYLRRDLPTNRADVSGVISSVATANQLFLAGYRRTAMAIKDAIEDLVGLLPRVSEISPAIGWNFYSEAVPYERFNKSLHRKEFRGKIVTPSRKSDPLVGDSALAKCFGIIGSRFIDPRHLLSSVGSWNLALKSKWVPSDYLT